MWELEDDRRPLVALRWVSLATCWTSSFVTSSRISVSRVLVMTIWGRGVESLKRLASPRGECACTQGGSSVTHWNTDQLEVSLLLRHLRFTVLLRRGWASAGKLLLHGGLHLLFFLWFLAIALVVAVLPYPQQRNSRCCGLRKMPLLSSGTHSRAQRWKIIPYTSWQQST